MSLIAPKTALVSLSDKSNLDELIKFLLDQSKNYFNRRDL